MKILLEFLTILWIIFLTYIYLDLRDNTKEYINVVHNILEEQEQVILDYSEDETVIDAIQEGINYEEYFELENKLIKEYILQINNNK